MKGGADTNKPQPQPDPANLSEKELASNQEATTVPWFVGTQKRAVTWVTPIYNMFSKDGDSSAKKGGDGKGKGGGSTIKNFYGTIAGVVCVGPASGLVSLLIDGRTVWPTSKGWADDVIDVRAMSYSRKSNVATVEFASSHRLHKGQKFVLSEMPDASFDCAAPTAVTSASDLVIKFANAGADVIKTSADSGLLTKAVHYIAGDVVRYAEGIWKAVSTHDGTPDKAPPNAVYWAFVSVKRVFNFNPYPFTVPSGGHAYLYWGTDDQVLDSAGERVLAQNGHPGYRRQVVLVLKDFLFGTERQAAPNVEVVLEKEPSQTVVEGLSDLIDGQANPKLAEIELITDPVFGLGKSAGLYDAPSAQSIAEDLASKPELTYISPLIDTAISARQFVSKMVEYYDGFTRFNGLGKIESGRWLHNEAPPAFTDANTIDYNDLLGEIKWDTYSWGGTFSRTQVKFQDRARAFKDAARSSPSGFNFAILGENRKDTIDRPWITREAQALAHAAERGKIVAQPAMSGTITVRAEKAAGVTQGGLFLLTHDALGMSVACRCTMKTIAAPAAGKVTLRFERERGIAPLPFRPTPVPLSGTALAIAERIDLYQFLQPPPILAGDEDFRLIVLAARTSEMTRGLRPYFRIDDPDLFYRLGEQTNWCVKGTLAQDYGVPASNITAQRSRAANVATLKVTAHGFSTGIHLRIAGIGVGAVAGNYDDDDATITVTDADHFTYPNAGTNEAVTAEVNGTVSPASDDDSETLQVDLDEFTVQADLDKVSESQGADAINDDALLAFIVKDSDPTQFEIATVKEIRLDAGVYKFKVRRGRFATAEIDFDASDHIWIGYRTELVNYQHAKFAEYAESASEATFRLQAFTPYEEADLTITDQCPDITFSFTDPYAPLVAWTFLKKNGADIADFTVNFEPTDLFEFGMEITDANADLIEARLVARLGSIELTLWSASFEPVARLLRSTQFKLDTEGIWRVFGIAKDASGRVKEYELQPVGGGAAVQLHIHAAASSGVVVSPIANPPGDSYTTTQHVSLSTTTAGASIKYSKVAYGSAPGAFSTYTGPITVGLVGSSSHWTIYAYAEKALMTTSAIVRNDYSWESNF